MTYGIGTPDDLVSVDRGGLFREICSRVVPGAVALALSGLAGAWFLYVRPAPTLPADATRAVTRALAAATNVSGNDGRPAAADAVLQPALTPLRQARRPSAENPYGVLFDPSPYGTLPERDSTSLAMAQSPPLGTDFVAAQSKSDAAAEQEQAPPVPAPAPRELAQGLPVPSPRPPELAPPASRGSARESLRQFAQEKRTNAATTTTPTQSDERPILEKLFGARQQPQGPVLAYANPQDGLFGNARKLISGPTSSYDPGTAVYDISAHTVYMPNGARLEAHSGLGGWMDDPRHVSERMRGATPPNVYALQPREELFHGVEALRLIPIGNGEGFGRAGLLAHTYMLGPNGQSNGCVSFRDYQAFLRAYKNGEVKRLVVVANM
jgi:Protein of unknown function (DUF2778)